MIWIVIGLTLGCAVGCLADFITSAARAIADYIVSEYE